MSINICISDRIRNYIQACVESPWWYPPLNRTERDAIEDVYLCIRGSEHLNGLNPQGVAAFVVYFGCQLAHNHFSNPNRTVHDVLFITKHKGKVISPKLKEKLKANFVNEFNELITKYNPSFIEHYEYAYDLRFQYHIIRSIPNPQPDVDHNE